MSQLTPKKSPALITPEVSQKLWFRLLRFESAVILLTLYPVGQKECHMFKTTLADVLNDVTMFSKGGNAVWMNKARKTLMRCCHLVLQQKCLYFKLKLETHITLIRPLFTAIKKLFIPKSSVRAKNIARMINLLADFKKWGALALDSSLRDVAKELGVSVEGVEGELSSGGSESADEDGEEEEEEEEEEVVVKKPMPKPKKPAKLEKEKRKREKGDKPPLGTSMCIIKPPDKDHEGRWFWVGQLVRPTKKQATKDCVWVRWYVSRNIPFGRYSPLKTKTGKIIAADMIHAQSVILSDFDLEPSGELPKTVQKGIIAELGEEASKNRL